MNRAWIEEIIPGLIPLNEAGGNRAFFKSTYLRYGIPLMLLLSLMVSPSASSAREYLMRGADLACIIDNLVQYRNQGLTRYLIPIERCHEQLPPGGYRLSDLAQNTTPDVPEAAGRFARVLALAPGDLECLASHSVAVEPDAIYRFNTEGCIVERLDE